MRDNTANIIPFHNQNQSLRASLWRNCSPFTDNRQSAELTAVWTCKLNGPKCTTESSLSWSNIKHWWWLAVESKNWMKTELSFRYTHTLSSYRLIQVDNQQRKHMFPFVTHSSLLFHFFDIICSFGFAKRMSSLHGVSAAYGPHFTLEYTNSFGWLLNYKNFIRIDCN